MLGITRYRFELRALDPIRFPSFPGSAIRGVFGHGLKGTVCVTRLEHCGACALRHNCVHACLFETPVTLDNGQDAPHPLIFDVHGVPDEIGPGRPFFVEATLVGEAARHLPYLIQAWRRAGQHGLGRDRSQFELRSIEGHDFHARAWRPVYVDGAADIHPVPPFDLSEETSSPIPRRVTVELLTPYRGKRGGRLVTPDSFTAQGFLVSLVHRIDRLARLHDPHTNRDPRALAQAATEVTMTGTELSWREWIRYSTRQRTRMNLGGVVGSFDLEGEGLPTLWPALRIGQWIQAGKNTLFGLGCYRVTSRDKSAGPEEPAGTNP